MTYSEAKAKGIFDREEFQNYSKEEIMRAMKNERKKVKKEQKESAAAVKSEKKHNLL